MNNKNGVSLTTGDMVDSDRFSFVLRSMDNLLFRETVVWGLFKKTCVSDLNNEEFERLYNFLMKIKETPLTHR